ncbi:glutathione S-transferase family protein [Tropicimonas isoalkanivorans]|uniref:glutathione transferase n=1 Tax=Tropicimonas isoalkanivorans TaxID=441112 RepID=A0A1I1KE72_9RHOB|nr:glutathione S-transferase family protein [Tropicimonas isoalkanivorans]SFC59097.1 glutathione S-transferase [Tropicimonas isoalkanivorans]
MLTVHHLGVSQSERIVWLCEELGLPYELKLYQREPETGIAPPEYKALHPAGTAPVIEDGDVTLAESEAVIDYILAVYGNGRLALPADHSRFADYLYWYHFVNGTLAPAFMMMMAEGQFAQHMSKRADRGLQMLEDHLAKGNAWLAGDTFTAADIMMMFPLTTLRYYLDLDLTPYPNMRAYVKRLTERPAFKSARAKADPELEVTLD